MLPSQDFKSWASASSATAAYATHTFYNKTMFPSSAIISLFYYLCMIIRRDEIQPVQKKKRATENLLRLRESYQTAIICNAIKQKIVSPLDKLSRSSKEQLAPQVGLEPTTLRLTAACSGISCGRLRRMLIQVQHGERGKVAPKVVVNYYIIHNSVGKAIEKCKNFYSSNIS